MQWRYFGIVMCIFLCGCSNEVNKIRIVHTIGYDKEGEKIKGTIVSPNFIGGIPPKSETLKDTSETNNDILFGINNQSNYTIQVGQLRTVLFGMSYAKEDIGKTIRSLVNNPDIGRTLNLAITEQEAEEIIKATEKKDSLYIYNMINQNIKTGNIPNSNLHTFLCSYYSKWEDSFIPYLRTKGKNEVMIGGLTLLKNGKYVMNLNIDQSFIFTIINTDASSGMHLFPIYEKDKKDLILLQNINSKVKYSVVKSKIPTVHIKVKLNGMIKDYPEWINLENKPNVQLVEKQIEENIKKEAEKLIRQLQENNVDSLGIGSFIRSRWRNWSLDDYRSTYQKMNITVNVDTTILYSGIGE
ncbi:Ger(x)C family spore germination protein [Gottfriedia solisilvae]|uniref:Germination protein GerC n=1 Tax=Gottfriedia solisilvae TaxID=1516104 RepID=A0A8J3EZS0_9BACI|nr:Ger(x)C family spore germination protein [Gottfriedia solisilvae]GGI15577.1 germination protein GerC [Gottfriedia solisilvae]